MPAQLDLRRQAYLDEQLSVDETVAYLAALPPAEQAALQAERAYQAALAERLAEPVSCPPQVWERLRRELAAPPVVLRPPWWQRPLLLRLAAGVAIAALAAWGVLATARQPVHLTEHLEVARTVPQLAAQLDLTGSYDQIVAAMHRQGLAVPMHDPATHGGHHQLKLVGLRIFRQGDQCVAQLGYECCGQPVTVYISRPGSHCLPREVDARNLPEQWCLSAQQCGEYRIVAVGPHDIASVLKLFS